MFVKKAVAAFTALTFMIPVGSLSALSEPRKIEINQYDLCQMRGGADLSVFIVTKVNGDGTFIAQPLGEWLEEQDFCTVETKPGDGGETELRRYLLDPYQAAEEGIARFLPDGFTGLINEDDILRDEGETGVMEMVRYVSGWELQTEYLTWAFPDDSDKDAWASERESEALAWESEPAESKESQTEMED